MNPDIPTHWFDRQVALHVLRHYFQNATATLRVATGFFTVRGYNLVRTSARGKRMLILVGTDEPARERVILALVKEIMTDLQRGIDADRRKTVRELVARMEEGRLLIVDARAISHHAKLFVIDEQVALVASSNLTGRGLIEAIEAGYTVTNPAAVNDFLMQFDEYFTQAEDISARLLLALKKWLEMVSPWEIYLKTLSAIKALPETQFDRPTYRKPTGYQTDIIARSLRQIEEYGGAMVVASTGLGKTVIGTDIALRLHEGRTIRNVLIFGPEIARRGWEDHMRSAGIRSEYFNYQVLDTDDPGQNGNVADLQRILAEMDSQWLFIFDESHELRRRLKDEEVEGEWEQIERLAFRTLIPAIQETGVKVLLLTGTPFSTEITDINNQLLLLPHTNRSRALFPEFADYPEAWQVTELHDLKEAPISSVITTPYVVKHYGLSDDEGIFIDFHGQKKYIPKVVLHLVPAPVIFEEEVAQALDEGYFRTRHRYPVFRGTIENVTRLAWASSPWALRDVIGSVVGMSGFTAYKPRFKVNKKKRREFLTPLFDRLTNLSVEDDPKVLMLSRILEEICADGGKAIIYCERVATVAYLEQALNELHPSLQVASTVEMIRPGHYKTKPKQVIYELIERFAPVSHQLERSDDELDVFIGTDAQGVGINLQDAQAVINYDLAWTAIQPAQRAGRILRPWLTHRQIGLYAFVPDLHVEKYKQETLRLIGRWATLTRRHRQSRQITDIPVLASDHRQEIDMALLGTESRTLPPHPIELGEIDIERTDPLGISRVFQHMAVLEQNKEDARRLEDDITSAMAYRGNRILAYVLLRHAGQYRWALYDVERKRLLRARQDVELLNMIECERNIPAAEIDPEWVEQATAACLSAWCKQQGVAADEVVRVCNMLLVPKEGVGSFGDWLS